MGAAVLVQLLRQQGRILLRLEALERTQPSSANSATIGPAVGAPFPEFRLPDFTGRVRTLADFAGRRVVLVNWNTSCGFCERIAPELASLGSSLKSHQAELVLVSSGNVDVNRAMVERHGLKCAVLLSDWSPGVEPFAGKGTPIGYVLDERGRVTKGPVVGADQVLQATRELAARKPLPTERPLSESRIKRDGIPAGTVAPTFALEDVSGKEVSLADYAGRRVLLVFSDPHCGPCNSLIPQLVRAHEQDTAEALAIVMVSRGSPAENRTKIAEHGISFPVLIQPGWSVSREYGIFATPSAFLIREDGVIGKNVAVGVDAIVALARHGASVEEVAMQH